jgi:hypothetical protein
MKLFDKKDGKQKELKTGGNGHGSAEDIESLRQSVNGLEQGLVRVIKHLQTQSQTQAQPIATPRERRDLFQVLTDPPDDALPSLTDVSPLMATLIPAMNVIKWNYTPESEYPVNEKTQRPYGAYLLWELDYARWNLSKNAHNAIRLCDVVQTRGETQRMGIVAE